MGIIVSKLLKDGTVGSVARQRGGMGSISMGRIERFPLGYIVFVDEGPQVFTEIVRPEDIFNSVSIGIKKELNLREMKIVLKIRDPVALGRLAILTSDHTMHLWEGCGGLEFIRLRWNLLILPPIFFTKKTINRIADHRKRDEIGKVNAVKVAGWRVPRKAIRSGIICRPWEEHADIKTDLFKSSSIVVPPVFGICMKRSGFPSIHFRVLQSSCAAHSSDPQRRTSSCCKRFVMTPDVRAPTKPNPLRESQNSSKFANSRRGITN